MSAHYSAGGQWGVVSYLEAKEAGLTGGKPVLGGTGVLAPELEAESEKVELSTEAASSGIF